MTPPVVCNDVNSVGMAISLAKTVPEMKQSRGRRVLIRYTHENGHVCSSHARGERLVNWYEYRWVHFLFRLSENNMRNRKNHFRASKIWLYVRAVTPVAAAPCHAKHRHMRSCCNACVIYLLRGLRRQIPVRSRVAPCCFRPVKTGKTERQNRKIRYPSWQDPSLCFPCRKPPSTNPGL